MTPDEAKRQLVLAARKGDDRLREKAPAYALAALALGVVLGAAPETLKVFCRGAAMAASLLPRYR